MSEALMYSIMANIFLSVCCIGLLIINRVWKCMFHEKSDELDEMGHLCKKLTTSLKDRNDQIDELKKTKDQ